MNRVSFFLLCSLGLSWAMLSSYFLSAQIVVTPNVSASILIDRLVGTGITYTNPVLTCPNNGSGKFDNGLASSVLIDSGVILTTGRALTNGAAYGVNGTGANFASVNNSTNGGDANLSAAAGTTANNIHDLCKLEFDFIPTGDTIQFKYRFGSEEYPVYNCSQYNDIFAFFLSGPGYAVPTNVALVPGTNIPVTINSINNGTISTAGGGVLSNCTSLGTGSPFTSLYVNNSGSTSITYNGLTSVLTAKAAVTPCSTYHMKFAIADLSDHVYDSGVFLQAGSFSSDIATVTNVSSSNSLPSATPFAMEGCSAAVITIARPQAKSYPQVVTYTLSGTATNGTDVATLSGSATIPAFATTTTITVNALQDGISEGTETLIFGINGSLCGGAITETLTMNILEYPKFTKPLSDTICSGQSISLSAIPVPANPNLSFNWSPAGSLSSSAGSTVNASPFSTTTYTITSSYPGCPSVDSTVTVAVDPIPTLSLTSTNITCNGLGNGSITATGTASLPLTMTLNPSGTVGNLSPSIFNNLPANTYTVTISSSIGCTTTMTATVTAPSLLSWTNIQFVNPTCNASNNGSITVAASGGTGTITYTLLPIAISNTTGTFPSLTAGGYTVNAVDANGCTVATTFTLSASNALAWTTTNVSNITPCFGNVNGGIQVTAVGGTGLLTYAALPSGGSNTTGLYTGLSAGSYTVQVTDVNGCSNATTVNITQPSLVHINSVSFTPLTCYGNSSGAITINSSGGTGSMQYTLLPGNVVSASGMFTNLSDGNYTVVSSDANGCSVSTTVNVTQPALLQFSSFNVTNVTCNGGNNGTINATVTGGTGGVNYVLMPSAIVNATGNFSSLPAGSYTVQVIDANTCTVSSATSIVQPPALLFNTPSITNVSCHGGNTGSLQLTASGGTGTVVYDLNAGSVMNITGVFSSLTVGSYTVEITDAAACSNSTVVSITEPPVLQFSAVNVSDPSCSNVQNGTISFNGSGGTPFYVYALNTGAFSTASSFNTLAAGVYTLHVKDTKGCLKDSVISLSPASVLFFSNVIKQDVSCKYDLSGFITLGTSGGYAPYTYQLNSNPLGVSGNFLNLNAGVYSIFVTDTAGCSLDTVIQIVEPAAALSFSTAIITNILCFGDQSGQINVSAGGGTLPYQYAMNGGLFQSSGIFTSLVAGNYTITLKDGNGCQKDSLFAVQQPSAPLNIYLNRSKEITCIGLTDGELQVGAMGGVKPYSYSINGVSSGADSNFLSLNPGNYLIQVTDSNGCTSSMAYSIAVPVKKPYIYITDMVSNLCNGDSEGMIDWIGSNGYAPYSYVVNGNFIDTVSRLSGLASGNYLIELTDSAGCKADTAVSIANSTTLEASVEAFGATCAGNGNDGKAVAIVSGGALPYMYTWLGYMNQSTVLENVAYGLQQFIVQDADGCTDTVKYTIDYSPCCDVYMPNAFSPNNDGHNDTYRIIHYGIINLKSFEVFDRWGKQVFITNIIDGSWDGKMAGSDYEFGTYYYLIKYYCQFSKQLIIKSGDFTLIR